jgi:hypothetical protein
MKFILEVSATDGATLGWHGVAVVDLSKENIQKLLVRQELFQMVRSKDDGLWDMFFADDTACCYYENADLEDVLNTSELATFEQEEVLLFLDSSRDSVLEEALGDVERTEIDQVVIDDVGVRFYAGLRNSDESIESVYLKYDRLLTALRASP